MKIKQIPDIAGSAETITRSCCLCHFLFAVRSDGEWDWHEFAIAHSLLFEIYFCLCMSSSWDNSDKQQKDGAFPQINRDQSLNFDWMTKQNQLLKACFYFFLIPASWELAGSSQNQSTKAHRRELSPAHYLYWPHQSFGICLYRHEDYTTGKCALRYECGKFRLIGLG